MSEELQIYNKIKEKLEAEALYVLGLSNVYSYYLSKTDGDVERAVELMRREQQENPEEHKLMLETQEKMIDEYVKRRMKQVALTLMMNLDLANKLKN